MNRTSQYCWRKGACQNVHCKFIHPKDKRQYYWQKDACVKDDCKFIHPRDSSLDNNPKLEGAKCLQLNDGNFHSSPVECGTASSTRSKENASRPNVEMVIGIDKENESSTGFERPRQTVRSLSTMVFYGTKSQIDSASSNSVPIPPMQSELNSTDVDIVRHSRTNSSDTHVSATGTGKQSARVWKKSEPKESRSIGEPLHNSNLSKAGKRGNRKKSAKVPEIQLKSIGSNSDHIQSTDVSKSALPLPEVVDMPKVKRAPKTNSDRGGSSRSHSHRENVQQGGLNMNGCASAQSYQSITQIQPEWNSDETMAFEQHRHNIDGINDQISQIILSEDYSTNYEKHEASIRILRDNLVELESHVSIYDSVKSRACRELSSRPTELRNQIYREIYRLKCRLGAFSKRLDMEKYFGSGDRFLIVVAERE